MAKRAYVFKYNYAAPYAVPTGLPHNPTALKTAKFRKGEIVNAELKHHNNKPSILLYDGVIPIPLDAVRQVLTKEITMSADGGKTEVVDTDGIPEKKIKVNKENKKLRIIDKAILGALLGFGGVYYAEKKGYITEPKMQYRIAGALVFGSLFAYVAYRIQNKPTVVVTE
jgi:hypothetical protein